MVLGAELCGQAWAASRAPVNRRQSGDYFDDVVLVGHNPGMEELASGLCGATPEDVFVRMPTAALAHVAIDASHWSMVRWGAGQLRLLLTPKVLR